MNLTLKEKVSLGMDSVFIGVILMVAAVIGVVNRNYGIVPAGYYYLFLVFTFS